MVVSFRAQKCSCKLVQHKLSEGTPLLSGQPFKIDRLSNKFFFTTLFILSKY